VATQHPLRYAGVLCAHTTLPTGVRDSERGDGVTLTLADSSQGDSHGAENTDAITHQQGATREADACQGMKIALLAA
jgi:hypothetical protein